MELQPLITMISILVTPFSNYPTWYLTKKGLLKEKKVAFETTLIVRLQEMSEKYIELHNQYTLLTIEFHKLQSQYNQLALTVQSTKLV